MKRCSLLLYLLLLLSLVSCGETLKEAPQEDTVLLGEGEISAPVLMLPVEDGAELGEGETSFPLTITDGDGQQIRITIHTDEMTVGEALEHIGLVEGEEGPYGLYVKTVNGMTADYDADKTYWAFYINDQYALSGVEQTEILSGDAYELRVEQG